MSKLNETDNLIELYMHHVGKSQTPTIFHFWCCLSLIAACMGDRFWYYSLKDKKILPNLYVLLLAPSGLGKNDATDTMMKFAKQLPRINFFRGKTTIQHIIDWLSKAKKDDSTQQIILENAKLFLVTPEMSMSIGSGPLADQFVKVMTELYTGGDYDFIEGTRTHGTVTMRGMTFNWLLGSSKDWLVTSISKDAIEGGFFARMCCVSAEQDFDNRVPHGEYPNDYEQVVEVLHSRFRELCALTGEFSMTPEAKKTYNTWFMERPAPEDEMMAPSWNRQGVLVIKLAMILAIAKNVDYCEFTIGEKEILFALQLSSSIMKNVPDLITFATATPETKGLDVIAKYIRQAGTIHHYRLMQKASGVHIKTRDFREFIDQLRQSKRIEFGETARGGRIYIWKGGV